VPGVLVVLAGLFGVAVFGVDIGQVGAECDFGSGEGWVQVVEGLGEDCGCVVVAEFGECVASPAGEVGLAEEDEWEVWVCGVGG
jgi:hypothetical protein